VRAFAPVLPAWCIILLVIWGACPAQTGDEMFKNIESEADYQDLLSILDAALKKPINLMEADTETMAALPWVSPWLAARIAELRESGRLATLDDLMKIEGVTQDIVDLLEPFVVVRPVEKALRFKAAARMRVISGPPRWSLEANKTYFTLRADYGGLGAGFTLDKDKYETQVNDFQSVYAEQAWPSVYLVAGNYVLTSGYGLVFSPSYGHSPSTVGPFRFSRRGFGLKPYTSTVENFALGGAAVAVSSGGMEACVALSSTHLDARISEDGLVESIQTTGTHVSTSETEGKDSLREDLAGLALRYDRGRLRAGFSLSLSRFDHEFEASAFPWIEGRTSSIASADLTYMGGEFGLFGEAGLSQTGGTAFLGGVAFERPNLDLLALGRKYARSYFSLHSRPFSAYSRATAGETGLFLRLTLKPAPRTVIVVSNDLHRKDLGLGRGLNPTGSETLFELGIGFGAFRVEVSEKITESEDPPSGVDDLTREQSRYRTRLDLEYKPHSILWLRLRLEGLHSGLERDAHTERYSSDLLRLDMRFAAASWLSLKAGFYAFRVEDYSSRLYQYEPGLPYYPSLEMLKSDGSRWYVIGVVRFDSAGSATVKFGTTQYDGDEKREDLRFDYGVRF
jgi:hypothetical protein